MRTARQQARYCGVWLRNALYAHKSCVKATVATFPRVGSCRVLFLSQQVYATKGVIVCFALFKGVSVCFALLYCTDGLEIIVGGLQCKALGLHKHSR